MTRPPKQILDEWRDVERHLASRSPECAEAVGLNGLRDRLHDEYQHAVIERLEEAAELAGDSFRAEGQLLMRAAMQNRDRRFEQAP